MHTQIKTIFSKIVKRGSSFFSDRRPVKRLIFLSMGIAFIVSPLSAHANPADLSLQPYGNGYYLVSASESSVSPDDAGIRCRYAVTNSYKELSSLAEISPVWVQNDAGNYIYVLSENDLLHLRMVHDMGQEWCARNMAGIVPNGSTLDQAILLCANWIADHMTYDKLHEKMVYNQNAVYGFRNHSGVCATYTSMFNTMIDYLPFDPASGLVSYNLASATHVNVQYISNSMHSWSAIRYPDGWAMFDITFFDSDPGNHKPEYLWMGASALADGKHNDYISLDYIEPGAKIKKG